MIEIDWITAAFILFITFKVFGLGVVAGIIWADREREKDFIDNTWNPFRY